MTTPQEPTAQVRKILNHYNSHLADIMKKYVVAEPRIKPGRSKDFDSDITHQMDIEQASLLQLIEAEATRREREARIDELENIKNPDNDIYDRHLGHVISFTDIEERIAELKS